MITVFANKSLLFRNPKTGEEAHIQAKELGKQLPDWIVNDPLFELARNDGSITAMGDIRKDKSIENGDFNKPGSIEKDFNSMEIDELKSYAETQGIELGKATSKDGIISKIKESQSENTEK